MALTPCAPCNCIPANIPNDKFKQDVEIILCQILAALGSGGSQTLAQTLILGNITGGEDIIVSSGDKIRLVDFTAGSVIFAGASGFLSQDNANFFWDDTNNRHGIGTNSPVERLHVVGGGLKISGAILSDTASSIAVDFDTGAGDGRFLSWGSNTSTNGNFRFISLRSNGTSVKVPLFLDGATGFTGVNTVTPAFQLDVITNASDNVMRIRSTSSTGYSAIRVDASSGSTALDERGAFGYGNGGGLYPNQMFIETTNANANVAPPDFVIANTQFDGVTYFHRLRMAVYGDGSFSVLRRVDAVKNLSVTTAGQTVILGPGTASLAAGQLTIRSDGNPSENTFIDFQTSASALTRRLVSLNTGDFLIQDSAGTTQFALKNDGKVGIGSFTPGALLDVGAAGSILGTLRLEGNTSGYVQIQPAAAAGSWTLTLPATDGNSGELLTTNGSGVTSWSQNSAGKTLFYSTADIQSIGTTATDMYSNSVAGNTLHSDGDSLEAFYSFVLINATTKRFKLFWRGDEYFDSGVLTVATLGYATLKIELMREDSAHVRVNTVFNTSNTSTISTTFYAAASNQDWTVANSLVVTGQVGAGATNGDITATMNRVNYIPAP